MVTSIPTALDTVLRDRDSAVLAYQPAVGTERALTIRCQELGLSTAFYSAVVMDAYSLIHEFVGHLGPVDGAPALAPTLSDEVAVVIIDELDCATPDVQALIKEMVEHNRLNGKDLPIRRAVVVITTSRDFAAEVASSFTVSF